MITTGEIKRVFQDLNGTTVCDVDIPLFKSTITKYNDDNNLTSSIYTATISTPPGLYMPYEIGDLVYVGFINHEISEPVVLGKIHKGLPKDNESSSFAYLKTLDVTDKVKLAENIIIGDIKYEDLKNLLLELPNIKNRLNTLETSEKLLWTNQSPNSAFQSQSITTSDDMSNYKYIVIIYKQEQDDAQSSKLETHMKFNYELDKYGSLTSLSNNEICVEFYRLFKINSSTTIQFNDGWKSSIKDNTSIIPLYIYGTNVM